MLAAAGPADDSVFYYPKAQPKGRKRKKYMQHVRPPKVPTGTCPAADAQAQPDRATHQPRSASHSPVSGPLGNSFIRASWWFFRRSSLIFSFPHSLIPPPAKREKEKKKGCKKKNQLTLLRDRSGAQQPPALCPTAAGPSVFCRQVRRN